MRRIALVLSLVLMASLAAVAPAGAAGDTKGPACANIVDGGGFWDGTTLTFEFTLAKPACRSVTYTLYVTLNPNGGTVSTSTYTVDSSGRLIFSLPIQDPDLTAGSCNTISVYGTTSLHHHLADRAPDDGTLDLADAVSCGTGSRSFH